MLTKSTIISLVLLSACLLSGVQSLFEREKGLHDWRIENLGELKDLKFLENTPLVYTLSVENVLTLFDIDSQQIVWKKELPAKENIKLRYLSRNLLVYSDERALLINSASHIIYEVQYDAFLDPSFVVEDSGLAVEFFELKGHVYSVFAKDYKLITYRDYQQIGVLEYTNYTAQQFKPLQMIYDRPSQQLILLAQVGDTQLRSFNVDVLGQEMTERDSVYMPKDVKLYTRTANYFALKQEDQVMFYLATNLFQQLFLGSAKNVDFSLQDDVVLILPEPDLKPRFFNVALNKEEKLPSVVYETCTVNRVHESETIERKSSKEDQFVYYTVQCKHFLGLFTLRTSDNDVKVLFKTNQNYGLGSQPHGKMRRSFKSATNLITQLGDLSLHNIEISTIERKWSREESLSRVRQVEVIEQSAVRIESELEYVRNVKQESDSFANVPSRIATRYRENFQYLVKHLKNFAESFGSKGSIAAKESMNGLFGFKKVFLLLTDVGRLIALSATDGKVQWAEYQGTTVQKVIVRNMLDREINEKGPEDTQTKQIGVIVHDEIKFLDPRTGKMQTSFDLAETTPGVHRDFIIISLSKSGAQFILAIQDDSLEKGTPLIAYPPDQFNENLMVGENVFFTYVNKQKGVISGYKLRKDLVAIKVWSMNLDNQGEQILRIETQFQTASSIDHLHFTPTAFSGENIIYKHLDSNVFALATLRKNSTTSDELIVYLINGVSGKVLHRYYEKRVRLDLTIDFVLSENIFILAFQRQEATGLTHQEITVTELYSQRQEDNTKKLLMEYYSRGEDRLLQKHFSSFLVDQPVIVQESYVLPFSIKALALTQTLHHITGKNLVVLTQNNQVYQVDHNLFSARRPHPEDNTLLGGVPQIEDPTNKEQTSIISSSDLKSKELPPYDAVIPVISTKYLSYGLNLLHLREIRAFPTRLESTSQILTYGFDIFFMRISPENNFDLLQEYFNYTLLFLFIGGLALSTLILRNYSAKTKRHANFMIL